MLIKFTETSWLNIELDDIGRIDVDSNPYDDLSNENSSYFVRITLRDGTELTSGCFKTKGEATQCVVNLIHALNEED